MRRGLHERLSHSLQSNFKQHCLNKHRLVGASLPHSSDRLIRLNGQELRLIPNRNTAFSKPNVGSTNGYIGCTYDDIFCISGHCLSPELIS
jgi:hypothetical protein